MRKFRSPFFRWFGDRSKNVTPVDDLEENSTRKVSPLLRVVMGSHQRQAGEQNGTAWARLGAWSSPCSPCCRSEARVMVWLLECEHTALSSVRTLRIFKIIFDKTSTSQDTLSAHLRAHCCYFGSYHYQIIEILPNRHEELESQGTTFDLSNIRHKIECWSFFLAVLWSLFLSMGKIVF